METAPATNGGDGNVVGSPGARGTSKRRLRAALYDVVAQVAIPGDLVFFISERADPRPFSWFQRR